MEKEGNRSLETGEDNIAMTLSVAKEANAFSAGNNGACSNGRSRENKCSSSQRCRAGARTGCGGSS